MSSTPLSVLRPGLRLVNNMTMRAKLGVMTLLACLPLAYLLVGTIDSARSDIDVTAHEREGVAIVRRATALEAALLGVASRPDAQAAAAIDAETTAMATTVAGLHHVDVADLWRPGAQALAQLARASGPRDDAASLARLRALVLQTAERSALFFDPEPVSYFLMDQSVERLLPWAEDLGRLQRLAAAGTLDANQRATLLETAARLDREIELAQAHNEALGRAGFKLPSSWQAARASAQRQAELARLAASVAEPAARLQEIATNATSALQAVRRFDDDLLDALDGLLVQRIDQRYRSCALQITGVLLAVLAMVYVGACFHSSFVARMRALDDALEGITRGDLAARIDIAGKDEIASMGRRMERMAMSLSALIAEIRTSAVRVEQAGQQVAADGRSMSHRADAHASGLRQSLQRVEALSRAVESTAGETDGLGSSTQRLMDNGEHGTQSMREAVVAITALEASMRRVAEINGMIDDIAFQTNLLALNAAVEAARAGEAGKGFAVVAAEVRQLAQRCAEAAGEVGALIEQTTTHAQQSSALIQDMSGTMQAMNDSVTTIADRIRSISRDAGEQSSGLGSVASTVGSLDELTRDNARAISASTQASQTLVTQAVALGRSVQSVRLRQGSADEARALVERARAVVRELGRDAAIESFATHHAEWVDRDMYLFGLDRSGHFNVHCLNTAFVGQHISKVASVIAFDDFIDDLQRLASHDGAWIDYAVANPATGQQQRKNSFVVRIDDDLVLGCGVYRREAPLDAVNGHGSARELAVAEEAGL